MAAPILFPLTSPEATRTLTLSTTVQAITIARHIAGQMSGIRLVPPTGDTTVRFLVEPGYRLLADDTAPTADYIPIGSTAGWPVEVPLHQPASNDEEVVIHVWATSGSPVLSIHPVPLSR